MPGPELAELQVAGALHDLGKLAVPQEILDKPGPLSPEEWAVVRRHPAAGEEIVLGVPALAHMGPLLRAMHEHWDGGGYPDGLRGEQIPLAAAKPSADRAMNEAQAALKAGANKDAVNARLQGWGYAPIR